MACLAVKAASVQLFEAFVDLVVVRDRAECDATFDRRGAKVNEHPGVLQLWSCVTLGTLVVVVNGFLVERPDRGRSFRVRGLHAASFGSTARSTSTSSTMLATLAS